MNFKRKGAVVIETIIGVSIVTFVTVLAVAKIVEWGELKKLDEQAKQILLLKDMYAKSTNVEKEDFINSLPTTLIVKNNGKTYLSSSKNEVSFSKIDSSIYGSGVGGFIGVSIKIKDLKPKHCVILATKVAPFVFETLIQDNNSNLSGKNGLVKLSPVPNDNDLGRNFADPIQVSKLCQSKSGQLKQIVLNDLNLFNMNMFREQRQPVMDKSRVSDFQENHDKFKKLLDYRERNQKSI